MAKLTRRARPSQKQAVPSVIPSSEVTATPSQPKPASPHFRILTTITFVIGFPYVLYNAYLYLHLQTSLIRPPVSVSSLRQLLVVGTQSSGSTEMVNNLSSLGLEIGHEDQETTWSFTRDGTVSWIHILRFLPGRPSSFSIGKFCNGAKGNLGFHPAMFRLPRRKCSYRSEWDACWSAECTEIITETWGCALEGTCETPFATSLLQVRSPLSTMSSLVVKFCPSLSEKPHAHFLDIMEGLFPDHPWRSFSCLHAVAEYWTLYNEVSLSALSKGALQGWYKREDTGACDVVELAGFLDESKLVSPHAGAVAVAACSERSMTPPPSSSRPLNRVNMGRVNISIDDITAIDKKLSKRVKDLSKNFNFAI